MHLPTGSRAVFAAAGGGKKTTIKWKKNEMTSFLHRSPCRKRKGAVMEQPRTMVPGEGRGRISQRGDAGRWFWRKGHVKAQGTPARCRLWLSSPHVPPPWQGAAAFQRKPRRWLSLHPLPFPPPHPFPSP